MAAGPPLVDYDQGWPEAFERLRRPVAEALGPLIVGVEHVGSTAVPGMVAKPIIDIDVVIKDRSRLPAVIERLKRLGYAHEGDLGLPGREAFREPPGLPEHHLYVVEEGCRAHRDHIDLREYLRANAGAAVRYANRKRELRRLLATDRAAYTEAKSGVIEEILREARSDDSPHLSDRRALHRGW